MRLMNKSSNSLFARGLKVVLLAGLACVVNCGGVATDRAANQTAGDARTSANASSPMNDARPSQNPERVAASTGAEPASGVLIDYRKERPNHKAPPLEAGLRRRIIQAAYGARAAPDDYSINSHSSGSFTAQGAREKVYLVQRGGPVASDPNGAQDLALVVFDTSDQFVARFRTSDFNFIIATSDTNGDGVNELLLEGSFYNMGTLGSSARLVELKSKQLRLIETFEGTYENPCDADSASQITAAAITYAADGDAKPPTFKVDLYRAPCPARGGEPNFGSFQPAPDASVKRSARD
jgi:hypothetical protein